MKPAGIVSNGMGDRRNILRAVEPTTLSARLLRPLVPTTIILAFPLRGLSAVKIRNAVFDNVAASDPAWGNGHEQLFHRPT